jgi:hypothetical protein
VEAYSAVRCHCLQNVGASRVTTLRVSIACYRDSVTLYDYNYSLNYVLFWEVSALEFLLGIC